MLVLDFGNELYMFWVSGHIARSIKTAYASALLGGLFLFIAFEVSQS